MSSTTGVLLDPSARWMLVSCRRKKIEKLPPTITRRYCTARSATAPLAPTTSRITGPDNNRPPSPNTIDKAKTSIIDCQATRRTPSRSPRPWCWDSSAAVAMDTP